MNNIFVYDLESTITTKKVEWFKKYYASEPLSQLVSGFASVCFLSGLKYINGYIDICTYDLWPRTVTVPLNHNKYTTYIYIKWF